MVTALVHMDPKQKRRLMRRARERGTSFSQEVREAIEMYLELSPTEQEELAQLAAAANRATDHMIKNLDDTLAYLRKLRVGKRVAR